MYFLQVFYYRVVLTAALRYLCEKTNSLKTRRSSMKLGKSLLSLSLITAFSFTTLAYSETKHERQDFNVLSCFGHQMSQVNGEGTGNYAKVQLDIFFTKIVPYKKRSTPTLRLSEIKDYSIKFTVSEAGKSGEYTWKTTDDSSVAIHNYLADYSSPIEITQQNPTDNKNRTIYLNEDLSGGSYTLNINRGFKAYYFDYCRLSATMLSF
jgi:hypothetical protein